MKELNWLLIIGALVSVLLPQVNCQGEQVPTDEVDIVHKKQSIVPLKAYLIYSSCFHYTQNNLMFFQKGQIDRDSPEVQELLKENNLQPS